jgi:hypothetical protein
MGELKKGEYDAGADECPHKQMKTMSSGVGGESEKERGGEGDGKREMIFR